MYVKGETETEGSRLAGIQALMKKDDTTYLTQ